jgi:hypothetical protein
MRVFLKLIKELDNFVIKLLEVEPLFQSRYISEYALLKSFDRYLFKLIIII